MNLFALASLPYSKQDEAWRTQMKAMRQELETATTAITGSLSDAMLGQSTGSGDLAAKTAVKRLQSAAKAKVEANQRAAFANRSVYTNKPAATAVKAGDSTIDLTGNTLTLGDGTQIDLKTGLKVASKAKTMLLGDGSVLNLDTGKIVSVTV